MWRGTSAERMSNKEEMEGEEEGGDPLWEAGEVSGILMAAPVSAQDTHTVTQIKYPLLCVGGCISLTHILSFALALSHIEEGGGHNHTPCISH